MSRNEVATDLAPKPAGPYSQAIAANGFLYTAGQTPHDPVTGDAVGTTIEEQTIQTMKNVAEVRAPTAWTFHTWSRQLCTCTTPGGTSRGSIRLTKSTSSGPTPHGPPWARSWVTSSSK